MSILDGLLGGGNSSTEVSGAAAANPGLALQASDVLHVLGPVGELTGIGDLSLSLQAPIAAAVDVSTSSSGSADHGGLLSGLL